MLLITKPYNNELTPDLKDWYSFSKNQKKN